MSAPGKTPVGRAVELIKAELPGFDVRTDVRTDTIIVVGAFTIHGGADLGPFFLPVPEGPGFERWALALVEKVRRAGIEKLGLDAVIEERERRALHRGNAEGYVEGLAAGIAKGRRDMLAEVLAARDDGVDEGPRNV